MLGSQTREFPALLVPKQWNSSGALLKTSKSESIYKSSFPKSVLPKNYPEPLHPKLTIQTQWSMAQWPLRSSRIGDRNYHTVVSVDFE